MTLKLICNTFIKKSMENQFKLSSFYINKFVFELSLIQIGTESIRRKRKTAKHFFRTLSCADQGSKKNQ